MSNRKKSGSDIAGIVFVGILFVCTASLIIAGTIALLRLML